MSDGATLCIPLPPPPRAGHEPRSRPAGGPSPCTGGILEPFRKFRKILSPIHCTRRPADDSGRHLWMSRWEAGMRTKFKLLGALALLLGGTTVTAAREPLVFIGSDTFETTIVPNRVGCPTSTSVSTEDNATGKASLLGRYTFTAGECVNLITLEVSLGFFTLTAADGSTMTGNYSGTRQNRT